MSYTRDFELGGVKFYDHCEQSIECLHGFHTYMINMKQVTYKEFWLGIILVLNEIGALESASMALKHYACTDNRGIRT